VSENNNNNNKPSNNSTHLDFYDRFRSAGAVPTDKLEEFNSVGFQLSRQFPRLYQAIHNTDLDEEFIREAKEGQPLIQRYVQLLKELQQETSSKPIQ